MVRERSANTLAYEAVLLYKLANCPLPLRQYLRIVKVLLGVTVSVRTAYSWLEGNVPKKALSPFLKALSEPRAYEIAMSLARKGYSLSDIVWVINSRVNYHIARKTSFGPYRVMKWLSSDLPARIPRPTIEKWIKEGRTVQITPLYISSPSDLEYLAYIVAARLCDGSHAPTTKYGYNLHVKDLALIAYTATVWHRLTGKDVDLEIRGGKFFLQGSLAIHYLIETGLWKLLAVLCPRGFLKGLFDTDGGIDLWIHEGMLSSTSITFYNTNPEIIAMAAYALTKLGYTFRIYKKKGTNKDCWVLVIGNKRQVRRFAREIGFRESRRKRLLGLVLSLDQLSPRQRYTIFRMYYEKQDNNRWKEKTKWLIVYNEIFGEILKNELPLPPPYPVMALK